MNTVRKEAFFKPLAAGGGYVTSSIDYHRSLFREHFQHGGYLLNSSQSSSI
jgi:hypothetical protein